MLRFNEDYAAPGVPFGSVSCSNSRHSLQRIKNTLYSLAGFVLFFFLAYNQTDMGMEDEAIWLFSKITILHHGRM